LKKILFFLTIFSAFFLLSACADTSTSENNELQSSVKQVWGTEIYVPKHDKYPVGIAYAEYLPILKDGKKVPDGGEPWLVNIMYFSEDEKSPTGNKHIDQWKENDALKEFIYESSYQNQFMIGLSIQKMGNDTVHPEAKEIEIDGHKASYYFGPARDQGNFVYLGINFEHLDYWYSIMYRIDDNNTEEDAIEFARSIIKNNE
jgi:hypothetical protein